MDDRGYVEGHCPLRIIPADANGLRVKLTSVRCG